MIINMHRTLRGAAVLALSVSFVGFGTLAAHAGAKSPEPTFDVSFENVSGEFLTVKYVIPKIDIKGSNLAKADIEKLFAKDATLPISERLKTFSATEINLPTIEYSFEMAPFKMSGSYNGTRFEKITSGKIGKTSHSGGALQYAFQVPGESELAMSVDATATFKKAEINDFDLAYMTRLWEEKAGPDDKEAKLLWSSGMFDGISIDTKDHIGNTATIEYGKLTLHSGPKLKMISRPLKEVYGSVISAIVALASNDKGPDNKNVETAKAGALNFVELIEGYESESYTLENYTIRQNIKVPNSTASEGLFNLTGKIAKMEKSGKLIQATGINFDVPEKALVKIDSISLKDFSIMPALAVAKEVLAKPGDFAEEDGQKLALSLYSNLGTLNFNNFDINVKVPPADEEDSGQDEPSEEQAIEAARPVDINIKLKDFTLRLQNPVNGIPSNARIAVDNLQLPVYLFGLDGKTSSQELRANLQRLGYENLNLSYALDASWNKDNNELTINEVRVAEEASGNALLKGLIANFTQDMFSTNKKLVQATAIGLLAKNVSLHVEDRGLLDRVIKFQAEKQGATADQLKTSLTMMVEMLSGNFAQLQSVQTLKQALLSFLQKPGTLDISIKAKNSMGLGLADFLAAAQDPTSIDPKIEVNATAK